MKNMETDLWERIAVCQKNVERLREKEEHLVRERSSLSSDGLHLKQCLTLLQEEHDCINMLQSIETSLGVTPTDSLKRYVSRLNNLTTLTALFSSYTANLELQTAKEHEIVALKMELHDTIERQTKFNNILQQVLCYMVLLQEQEQTSRNTLLWLVSVLRAVESRY